MKNVLNTGLRIVFVILLLATAAFVGSAAAYAETAPAAGEEDVSRTQKTADAELVQLQLGSSNYSVRIPRTYSNGEVTIDEVQANQVAYYFSPDSEMDFDIYQFPRPYPEMGLEEYTKKLAADFNGSEARTQMVSGIEVGTYLSRESYDGIEYDVMAALIEDGDDYLEVVFWLDGENAEQEATAILNTLSEVKTFDLHLGTLPFCMSVPEDFSLGDESGQASFVKGQTWYYYSENSPLDFDVYQWKKEGYTLEKYAIEEARRYEAERLDYKTINRVFVAYYYSYEEYEGVMYPVANYLFEEGNDFMKISFWLDGEIAVRQADRIVSTLRRTDR